MGLAATLLFWLLAPDSFEQMRHSMVREQIEARGVRSARVLSAVRDTPRHLFIPSELHGHAYDDRPLPIGYGQTISQPYIVALMSEMLAVEPHHRVLEIGTGSGYQAAVLARLAARVYSIEIVEELAKSSATSFRKLGLKNINVRHGDGYLGWPEEALYDRIILTAAPPAIPQALIDQLKPGGKLVAPVGEKHQQLVVIDKAADGSVKRSASIPVLFVPMVRGVKR